jgi:hypothetical protein
MFTWIDGHLLLVMIVCPVFAVLICGGIQWNLDRKWAKAVQADQARRRDAEVLRVAEHRLVQERITERSRIFQARGGAR